ncbi:MAG: myo-inositol 2-dehydrogenase / D-chiro-inositol 1-dehydrogenase [Thermomicrobiales bacterium]|nr:myo-inositol 2-dehydrogenase / D-chiro-inositol 1-dehydrogenase [Thermomicrobiales bacterium]
MTERIKIGLFGAGRIGRRHAQTLASHIPHAELAVICDPFPEAARAAAEGTRVGKWTTDAEAVLSDSSIRAVAIASSTDSHAPLIMAAAQAGKDIFCEKPIALDLPATDAALDAVEAAGVRLQIGFQRRYDKGFRRAKEMIAGGELGRIESIRDTMRDPNPPPRDYLATCGGLYRDMTIHNFDNVRWLMGDEVTEVFAVGTAVVDPMFAELGDIDTSIVTLRFAGGGIAVIDNSRRAGFGYDVRTEIFGSKGALFVGYSRDTPILHLTPAGVASDHVHWFLERFDQAYVDELRDFVDSIVHNRPPAITGDDGRAAMVLAYACEASLKENRPVPLDRFARKAAR